MANRIVVPLAVVAALVLGVTGARADADPASDVLLGRDVYVFYPFGTSVSGSSRARLEAAVGTANEHGVALKIAIVGQKTDLGSVSQLYRHPKKYARFLSTELSYVSKARILTVMPNGFGLAVDGRTLPRELAAVGQAPAAGSTDGTKLADAANAAVDRLLALHGLTPAKPKNTGSSSDRIVLAVGALVLAAVIAGGAYGLRRWRPHAA